MVHNNRFFIFFYVSLLFLIKASCIKSNRVRQESHDAFQGNNGMQRAGGTGALGQAHIISPKRVKGVWVSHQFENYDSQAKIRAVLTEIKLFGFNTVSPVVWRNACPLWDSSLYTELTRTKMCPDSKLPDTLQALQVEASRLGLRVIPWFELGFKIDSDSPLYDYAQKKAWILAGLKEKGRYYLNIKNNSVTQFILNLSSELAQKYGIKEVMWDDHLGLPGADPKGDKSNSLNQFNKALSSHLKSLGVFFWLAHHRVSWAKKVYNAHWDDWVFDEFIIEAYVNKNFQKDVAEARLRNAAIAIATGLGEQNTWEQAVSQVKQVMADPNQDFFLFSYGHIKKHDTTVLKKLLLSDD